MGALWRWLRLIGVALVLAGLPPGASRAGSGCAGDYASGDHAPGTVRVSFHPGSESAGRYNVVTSIPGVEVRAVRAPAGQECAVLEALRRDPGVAFAELDYAAHATDSTDGQWQTSNAERLKSGDVHLSPFLLPPSSFLLHPSSLIVPNDPGWASQWGPVKIQAPAAWGIVTGTSDIVIAVLDSGIQLGHEDLASKLWTNLGEIPGNGIDDDGNGKSDDVHGWHFFHAWSGSDYVPAENANVLDEFGHGTHVSGIAAAAAHNGVGIAGIAWGARVLPVKVLDQYGNGWYSDIAAGIIYAADNGARIINLSLGGAQDSQTLRQAVDYARARGALAIAATGNSGGAVLYPAAYEPVLAVAATDQDDQRASFSNAGPQVDLAAPGVDIYSTWYRGNYFTKSGTSMAAPHASGAAALIWTINPLLSADQVAHVITSTARDVSSPGWDAYTGWGRLDVYQAVQAAEALRYGVALAPAADERTGAPGEVVSYTLRLTNTGAISGTFNLAYTGNAWGVQLPVTQTMLASGEGADVIVRVAIPITATHNQTDTARVTATGPGGSDLSKLITTAVVVQHKIYLPLIYRSTVPPG